MKAKLIALAVSLLAVATIGVVGAKAVDAAGKSARECDSFSIIKCGTKNPVELRTEYDTKNTSKSNGTTQKQADIPKIFSAFGISRAELNGSFKDGEVRRNGDVVVGGKVVAKNAKVGIRNVSGDKIAGTNAVKAPASKMAHNHSVMAKFNSEGKFMFAVMESCGNPVSATPVKKPAASCEGITASQLSRNSFNFVGRSSTKDGAKIESYRFTATDASGRVVATRTVKSGNLAAESGKFEFANPGRYTVRVYVNSTAGDNLTSDHCVTVVEVAPELKPGVSIDKTVNDKESVTVGLNEEFTYKLTVKNTGNVDLKDLVVSDKQPANIKFLSASEGKIGEAGWAHVIPELKVGASASFTIKAKVVEYQAGDIKNTACVDAPAVPGGPDDCDDAFVKVPEPMATCDQVKVAYLGRTDFTLTGKASVFNGATINGYVFTVGEKTINVTSSATSATTDKQTIETPGSYNVKLVVKTSVGDKTSTTCETKLEIAEPNKVPVCDPETGKVITVPEEEAGNYKPVDDPACQPPVVEKIEVCELKTKEIIVINKSDYNAALHSTDLSKCATPEPEKVPVCDPETGKIINVTKGEEDNYSPTDSEACKAKVVPEKLVDTGAGDILGMAAAVTMAGALSHRMVLGRRR